MSISFKGIAADFVKGAKAFKSAILKAASEAPKVINELEVNAPELEALTNLVFPGATAVEQAALATLEAVASAVESAGSAATSNGLNVSLDKDVIAAVEAILPALKAAAAKL